MGRVLLRVSRGVALVAGRCSCSPARDRKDHKMRAFPVRLPSGARYWTVVDEDLVVVPAADGFLRQVRFGRDGAESTTKSYAHSIALFLRWCARTGRTWQAGGGQLGLFMTWLAHAGPAASGAGASLSRLVLAGGGGVPRRGGRPGGGGGCGGAGASGGGGRAVRAEGGGRCARGVRRRRRPWPGRGCGGVGDRPARRCPAPPPFPVRGCPPISEEGRGLGQRPSGCGRSPPE